MAPRSHYRRRRRALTPMALLLRRFQRDGAGAVAVEFALFLPLLLVMLMGGVELVAYSWAAGRVEDATAAVGDLVSQNELVDEQTLAAIFDAADTMIEANSSGEANTSQIDVTVSSVLACPCAPGSDDLCYTVLWSHRYQGRGVQVGHAVGRRLESIPEQLAREAEESFIYTETEYRYTPRLKFLLTSSHFTLAEEIYFRPRQSRQVSHTGAQQIDPTPNCAAVANGLSL